MKAIHPVYDYGFQTLTAGRQEFLFSGFIYFNLSIFYENCTLKIDLTDTRREPFFAERAVAFFLSVETHGRASLQNHHE